MNRYFSLFLSLLISNAVTTKAFGEDASAVKTTVVSQEISPSRFRLTVGAGVAYHNSDVAKTSDTDLGKYGGSVDLGAYYQLSESIPLRLGVNLGLQYWGIRTTYLVTSTKTTRDDEAYVLPFLPTVMYSFEVTRVFRPYLGLSVGPALYMLKTTYGATTDPANKNTSSSRIVLEGLFRPGIDFQFSKHFGLNVEPRIGILDNSAFFMTNTAAIFSF